MRALKKNKKKRNKQNKQKKTSVPKGRSILTLASPPTKPLIVVPAVKNQLCCCYNFGLSHIPNINMASTAIHAFRLASRISP